MDRRRGRGRPVLQGSPHSLPLPKIQREDSGRKQQTPLSRNRAGDAYTDPNLKLEKAIVIAFSQDWDHLKPAITAALNEAYIRNSNITEAYITIKSDTVKIELGGVNASNYLIDHYKIKGSYLRIASSEHTLYDTDVLRKNTASIQTEFEKTKPRWAEENRPKQQIKLRLDPELIKNIETKAAEEELNRTDWITKALLEALHPKLR